MDAQQRVNELKAANTVRRIIQRVRLATPETIDALENELFDGMEKQLEGVGSLHAKVQEEVEKALELARTRVAQIRETREKEEEMAQRPRELIEEIKQLMDVMQDKLSTLKEAACLEGMGGQLQVEDADVVRRMADDCSSEIKEFSQACVTRATEIKETTLPPEMKKTWTALAHEIVEVKRKAEITVTSAKAATFKATEALRKQRLEEMKSILRAKIKDSMASLPIASESVAAVEQLVEPFIYGKPREEEEMLALAERVEEALAEAEGAVANARQEIKPMGAEDVDDGDDEVLKKEIKAWMLSEEKVPRIRLGQLDRRVTRIYNIVTRWRKDRKALRNRSIIEAAKKELLEKVQGATNSTSVEEADPAIKAAEKAVEPCGKHKTMDFAEMVELADTATQAVNEAKAALDAVTQELCPIDQSLDEEVKAKLRTLAAPHLKKHQVKLGQYERRLVRAQNLLSQFKGQLQKKRRSENEKEREVMRRVIRHHLQTHEMTADALFETISAQSVDSSVIDKSAFLGFFESAEMVLKKVGSEEEEMVELTQEELLTLFASHAADGEEAISKDGFLKMIGRLNVAKATTLTTTLVIADGKVIRALRAGEELECLEGPAKEPKVGMMRVMVRCLKDDKVGWASMTGNAGSVFLREV